MDESETEEHTLTDTQLIENQHHEERTEALNTATNTSVDPPPDSKIKSEKHLWCKALSIFKTIYCLILSLAFLIAGLGLSGGCGYLLTLKCSSTSCDVARFLLFAGAVSGLLFLLFAAIFAIFSILFIWSLVKPDPTYQLDISLLIISLVWDYFSICLVFPACFFLFISSMILVLPMMIIPIVPLSFFISLIFDVIFLVVLIVFIWRSQPAASSTSKKTTTEMNSHDSICKLTILLCYKSASIARDAYFFFLSVVFSVAAIGIFLVGLFHFLALFCWSSMNQCEPAPREGTILMAIALFPLIFAATFATPMMIFFIWRLVKKHTSYELDMARVIVSLIWDFVSISLVLAGSILLVNFVKQSQTLPILIFLIPILLSQFVSLLPSIVFDGVIFIILILILRKLKRKQTLSLLQCAFSEGNCLSNQQPAVLAI